MGGGGTGSSPIVVFRSDRWRIHVRLWDIGGIPKLLGLSGESKGTLSSVVKLRFVQRGSGEEVSVAQDSEKPIRWSSDTILIPKSASTFSFTLDESSAPNIFSTPVIVSSLDLSSVALEITISEHFRLKSDVVLGRASVGLENAFLQPYHTFNSWVSLDLDDGKKAAEAASLAALPVGAQGAQVHVSVGFERADGLDHIERILVHRRALGKKYQTLSAFLPSFVKILPEDQRLLVTALGELVFTEVQYVYHLELITRLYLEPLLCRCLMTRADLWLLFSNVHLILEAHESLLADELVAWKSVKRNQDINVDFGEILLSHVSIFQLYAAYCSNQSAARQFVGSKVDTRPAIKAFVTSVEKRTDLKRETLRGFLIVPVQRLCKYPLLVREVMRRTDPASPSYRKLSQLLDVVTEQSNQVNERAIQVERFQEMIELSRRFVNATEFGLVSRNRYFGANYQVTHLSSGRSFLMSVMSDCLLLSIRHPDAVEGSNVSTHRIVRLINFESLRHAKIREEQGSKTALVLSLTDVSAHVRLSLASVREAAEACDLVNQFITKLPAMLAATSAAVASSGIASSTALPQSPARPGTTRVATLRPVGAAARAAAAAAASQAAESTSAEAPPATRVRSHSDAMENEAARAVLMHSAGSLSSLDDFGTLAPAKSYDDPKYAAAAAVIQIRWRRTLLRRRFVRLVNVINEAAHETRVLRSMQDDLLRQDAAMKLQAAVRSFLVRRRLRSTVLALVARGVSSRGSSPATSLFSSSRPDAASDDAGADSEPVDAITLSTLMRPMRIVRKLEAGVDLFSRGRDVAPARGANANEPIGARNPIAAITVANVLELILSGGETVEATFVDDVLVVLPRLFQLPTFIRALAAIAKTPSLVPVPQVARREKRASGKDAVEKKEGKKLKLADVDARAKSIVLWSVLYALKRIVALYGRAVRGDAAVVNQVHELLGSVRGQSPVYEVTAVEIERLVLQTDSMSQISELAKFLRDAPRPVIPRVRAGSLFRLSDLSSEEIGRQCTLVVHAHFRELDLEEYYRLQRRASRVRNARHFAALMEHVSQITQWVVSDILSSLRRRDRAALIAKFIGVAECCLGLQNYHTVMSLISALSFTPIARLKRTWEAVPSRSLRSLENLRALFAPTANYIKYRSMLADVNPPVVPYFGIVSKDLTFAEEMPDEVDGMLNWYKIRILAAIVRPLVDMQTRNYCLRVVPDVVGALARIPKPCDDEVLFRISCELEPPTSEAAAAGGDDELVASVVSTTLRPLEIQKCSEDLGFSSMSGEAAPVPQRQRPLASSVGGIGSPAKPPKVPVLNLSAPSRGDGTGEGSGERISASVLKQAVLRSPRNAKAALKSVLQ